MNESTMDGVDRWVCGKCRWMYQGPCRPHEDFGDSVSEVGAHLWDAHRSVESSIRAGFWEHLNVPVKMGDFSDYYMRTLGGAS